jgi:hypothetical protein
LKKPDLGDSIENTALPCFIIPQGIGHNYDKFSVFFLIDLPDSGLGHLPKKKKKH